MNKRDFYYEWVKKFNVGMDLPIFRLENHKFRNDKPARNIDEKYGTKISQQYKLPGGLTSDTLWILTQIYFHDCYTKDAKQRGETYLKKIYHEICKTYPVFSGYDNRFWDILGGIASEFNEADIIDFLKPNGGWGDRPQRYQMKCRKLEHETGIDLNYVPSNQTLNSLCKHFNLVDIY